MLHPSTANSVGGCLYFPFVSRRVPLSPVYPNLPPLLVQVCLWNVESGAVRRKLVVSGHADKPESEQPVEKLMFMKGDLR